MRTEEKKPPVVSQSHSRRAGECSVFSVATRAREGKGKERVFFGGEGAGPGQQQAKLKYEWIAPKLQALDGGPDWRQRVLPGAPRLASTSNPMPGAAWAPCLGAGSVSHGNLESPPVVLSGQAISSPSPHLAATSRTTSRTVQADEVAALRVRFSAGRPEEIKHDFWHIRPLWSFEAFEHKNVILLIHRWSIGDRKGHDRLLRAATIKQPDVRRKRPRWCMYEICTYAQATGVVLCLTVDGE